MSKLSILTCALILGSLAGACGGSEGDDDDGGEAGSGGTAASSGSGGSSASGGSSGSSGSAGKGGSGGSSGAGGSSGSSGKGGSGGSSGGSGGSNAGTGGSSGSVNVPGSTPVSDIDTDAEAEAVCDQIAAEVDPADIEALTEGTCTLAGLFAAAAGADCEMAKAECEAEPSEDPAEGCTSQDFPDCEITVDEFAACSSARVSVTAEYFSDITCDTDFTAIGELEEPEECTALFERCPELAPEEG